MRAQTMRAHRKLRARTSFRLRRYLAISICISHCGSSVIKGELPITYKESSITYKESWRSTITIRVLYRSLKRIRPSSFFLNPLWKSELQFIFKSYGETLSLSEGSKSKLQVALQDIAKYFHEQIHEQIPSLEAVQQVLIDRVFLRRSSLSGLNASLHTVYWSFTPPIFWLGGIWSETLVGSSTSSSHWSNRPRVLVDMVASWKSLDGRLYSFQSKQKEYQPDLRAACRVGGSSSCIPWLRQGRNGSSSAPFSVSVVPSSGQTTSPWRHPSSTPSSKPSPSRAPSSGPSTKPSSYALPNISVLPSSGPTSSPSTQLTSSPSCSKPSLNSTPSSGSTALWASTEPSSSPRSSLSV